MKTLFLIFTIFVSIGVSASELKELISVKSPFPVSETIDRLEAKLKEKGMTIFLRVKHQEGAKKVALELRDTELLIFGNPKVGTILMQCRQSVAMDLPLKVIAYQDDKNQVWISYTNPHSIAKKHDVEKCAEKTILKIDETMKKLVEL